MIAEAVKFNAKNRIAVLVDYIAVIHNGLLLLVQAKSQAVCLNGLVAFPLWPQEGRIHKHKIEWTRLAIILS